MILCYQIAGLRNKHVSSVKHQMALYMSNTGTSYIRNQYFSKLGLNAFQIFCVTFYDFVEQMNSVVPFMVPINFHWNIPTNFNWNWNVPNVVPIKNG